MIQVVKLQAQQELRRTNPEHAEIK
jgi:hypothetical protein